MEVKKITEGMTAPQVAQVIDDNFKAQNAILEEDITKQNNVIGVSEYKDFSEAEAVNVGDVRKYNGLLYECVEATTGAFDASKWKKSSFKAETEKKLTELGTKTSGIVFTDNTELNGAIKELYINDPNYIEGDAYVFYAFQRNYSGNNASAIGIKKNGVVIWLWQSATNYSDVRWINYSQGSINVRILVDWSKLEERIARTANIYKCALSQMYSPLNEIKSAVSLIEDKFKFENSANYYPVLNAVGGTEIEGLVTYESTVFPYKSGIDYAGDKISGLTYNTYSFDITLSNTYRPRVYFTSAGLIPNYRHVAIYRIDTGECLYEATLQTSIKYALDLPLIYTPIRVFITSNTTPCFNVPNGGLANDGILPELKYKAEAAKVFPYEFATYYEGGTELEESNDLYYMFGTKFGDSSGVSGHHSYTFESTGFSKVLFKPYSNHNHVYRDYAIFDTATKAIIKEEKCFTPANAFNVVYLSNGQTLVVTSSIPAVLNPTCYDARNDAYKLFTFEAPVIIAGGSAGKIEDNSFYIHKLSWKASDFEGSGYAYVRSRSLLDDKKNGINFQGKSYKLGIKNTSTENYTVGVVFSRTMDWSSVIKQQSLTIEAGSTEYVSLDASLIKDEYTDARVLIALRGAQNATAYRVDGSMEFILYSEPLPQKTIYAEEAAFSRKSVESTYSENAGYLVKADTSNVSVRESIPEGGVSGAVKVEVLSENQIRLQNTVDSDTLANKYRGIYWKIPYSSIEELKGIWYFKHSASYNTVNILKEMSDWGHTQVDKIGLSDAELNRGFDLYEKLITWKEANSDYWNSYYGKNNYLYITILNYASTGYVAKYEDTITSFVAPHDSKVIATEVTPAVIDGLMQEVDNKIQNVLEGTKQVTCWGDSLTAGAGSGNHRHQQQVLDALKVKGYDLGLSSTINMTYSSMLQILLGVDYKVTNCGVGGESINTIGARIGANLAKLPTTFTLPSDKSKVKVANTVTPGERLVGTWDDGTINPLLQGSGNSVNPCYVEGVECTLSAQKDAYEGTYDRNYYLSRDAEGDRDITIPKGTPIIMAGSKLYRNTEIAVIWCWQNGGYSGNEALIEKLRKIVSHLSNKKYIIVGLHSGNASSRAEQEAALESEFGDKFFNWRRYVSSNALYDFGITPTKDSDLTDAQKSGGVVSDITAMSEGSLPMSLWSSYIGDNNNATSNDKIHITSAGYMILGFKLYERMKQLGYIYGK